MSATRFISLVIATVILLLGMIYLHLRSLRREYGPRRLWIFALAIVGMRVLSLLLLSLADIDKALWLLAPVTLVLLAAGVAILAAQARDLGEPLWPDLVRSYDYSLLMSLVFGGQVVLAIETT